MGFWLQIMLSIEKAQMECNGLKQMVNKWLVFNVTERFGIFNKRRKRGWIFVYCPDNWTNTFCSIFKSTSLIATNYHRLVKNMDIIKSSLEIMKKIATNLYPKLFLVIIMGISIFMLISHSCKSFICILPIHCKRNRFNDNTIFWMGVELSNRNENAFLQLIVSQYLLEWPVLLQ